MWENTRKRIFLIMIVLFVACMNVPVVAETMDEDTPSILWGPYITGTTTTSTIVNVKTDTASSLTIEYATDAYFSANSGYDRSATDNLTTVLHHVPLAGLKPGTLYHYRVLYNGQCTGGLHFYTFPESGPVIFVVYSDTQDHLPTFSQLERHKLVADRIAAEPGVAFVLHSGDLVNNASNLSDWDRYFAAGRAMMANTTVFPALGNHDANHSNYYQAYGMPPYYSFDCADVHVAVLDSNDWAWPNFSTQSAWLATDLQTEKPFRFISFHLPPYTSERNHSGGYENIRLEWEDIFIEHNVTAVFNGHVHAYERFLAHNIHYFVSGTGGGPAYNLSVPRAEYSQNSLEYALAYIRVTIDPEPGTATAEMIRVADVSSDLKSITTLYPPGTVFETVVMNPGGAPVAEFTSDIRTGPCPLTVQFTDQSTGSPNSWAWDFDNDGIVDSPLRNPVTSYVIPGKYTVSLTVENACSSDTETKSDYIRVTRYVKPFPGQSNDPTDPDGDFLYEDINGNGRLDYDDIVLYYGNMQWIRDQDDVGIEAYDYNQNSRIDYDDVVVLYQELLSRN